MAADGRTPLHEAAWSHDLARCRELLAGGADPDARDAHGRSPLHDAIESGGGELVELLLEHGATVDICSAAILGDLERVEELLAADPRLATETSTGMTPMGWAAYGNQPAVARRLHAAGCPVSGEDLANAASVDAAAFMGAALELGADPDLRDGQGATALHHAACMQFTESTTRVATVLLEAGADPRARLGADGPTPGELLERERQRARPEGDPGHPCAAPPARKDFDGLAALLRRHGG